LYFSMRVLGSVMVVLLEMGIEMAIKKPRQ
jgi:hypothetical protein